MHTLKHFYVEELQDIYDAEHQITEALPKMAERASHSDLKQAFEMHLQQTQGQIERLEQVFQELGETPQRKTCKAMKGLVEEGQELLKKDADPDVMDAALIAAAQKVEHYEIATYGCLVTYARRLGQQEGASLLKQTLTEEERTDEKLTKLAEASINKDAEK